MTKIYIVHCGAGYSEQTHRLSSIIAVNAEDNQAGDNFSKSIHELLGSEAKLAKLFYEFVIEKEKDSIWLEWCHSSSGINLIIKRFEILLGIDREVTNRLMSRRALLNDMLVTRCANLKFSTSGVKLPSIQDLMKLNNKNHELDQRFLSGKAELEAYDIGEYFGIHTSTLCKTEWFKEVYLKIINNEKIEIPPIHSEKVDSAICVVGRLPRKRRSVREYCKGNKEIYQKTINNGSIIESPTYSEHKINSAIQFAERLPRKHNSTNEHRKGGSVWAFSGGLPSLGKRNK